MKIVDLTLQKFGRLTVNRLTNQSRNGSKVWECSCECGVICFITTRHLNRKKGVIKSCGCLKIEKDSKKGKESPYFKGYEGISQNFFNKHILRPSKGYDGKSNKRVPFDINIDIKHLWDLFQKQNGKCKLTGLEITLPTNWRDKFFTASVDRIDSSKGYVIGNVQWVHRHINFMKNTFEESYFIEMCKLVSKNNQVIC